ncbi:MAG TPA: lectin-like protein [Polyangiaceae bacterium]|nr:lectin-like protein [Polyangiaceae bacterium]
MTWRLRVGEGATLAVFGTSLLLASACSGDSNVDFDPIKSPAAGATSHAGTTSNDAGSSAVAGTSAGGSSAQAGSGQGGTSNQAGNAGATSGGADAGGTNTGGLAAGGAATAGSGGAAGKGGTAGAGGSVAGGAGTAGGGTGGGGGSSGSDAGGGGAGGGGGSGGGAGAGAGAGGGGAGGGGAGGTSSGGASTGGGGTGGNGGSGGGTSVPPGCTAATYGSHLYLFCGNVDNELAAAQLCADAGMNLISIGSAEENAFVAGKIKSSTWLGGSDDQTEGDWFWWDATQFTDKKKPIDGVYSNWGSGQPNDNGAMGAHENCVAILPATNPTLPGQWNDLVCDLTGSRAACEAPLP